MTRTTTLTTPQAKTVLILGANGKIGSHSALAFAKAGWSVRHFRRGENMMKAANGVDVIVNGLNPPMYHDWERQIPAITAQVIEAATHSGSTVIVPGNIYNFGYRPGVLDETTPQVADTRKGRIRIAMERAYAQAPISTILLRAGNFIDPNGNGDFMSVLAMRRIGKQVLLTAGDPDALQAYAYVPDWARAAVLLADRRQAFARFEDIPFPGHAFTMRQLLEKVQVATGQPIKLQSFPWWFMRLSSPFWELAREMKEMQYLYSMSHSMSTEKFTRILPQFQPTALDQVMLCGLPKGWVSQDSTVSH